MHPLLAFPALLIHPLLGRAQCASSSDFDWSSITPSSALAWTSCYGGSFQCARLSVPLDYSNSTDEQAAIAIVRIPSPYGLNGSAEYRGPALFNPGGAGGSGIDAIISSTGAEFQARIGSKYDIVSFDPRGVHRSTPEVARFPTPLAAAIWGETDSPSLLPALSIPGNLGLTLAKAELTNQIYGKTGASYLPFINTPFTAMDMLQIVQAHGMDKINYYGISYGTVLGAVFATMFPDKIERMVLDGVTDTEAYFHLNVSVQLVDTDRAINIFFESCFEAGSERCAFWAESPTKISSNLDAIYEQLKTSPLPAFGANGSYYGIVDYGFLRQTMSSSLYSPYETFQPLAQALAALSQGNADLLFELGATPLQSDPCSCGAPDPDINDIDSLVTILCNDGDAVNKTLEGWSEYYQSALNVSAYADAFAGLVMRCQSWPVAEKNPVRGPWGGNTTNPILFIGNTIDPVTPLVGAKKISSLFPGSTVLTQNSTGHTSLSAESDCTTDIVLTYFENATLPSVGAVCQVEGDIFPPMNGTAVV